MAPCKTTSSSIYTGLLAAESVVLPMMPVDNRMMNGRAGKVTFVGTFYWRIWRGLAGCGCWRAFLRQRASFTARWRAEWRHSVARTGRFWLKTWSIRVIAIEAHLRENFRFICAINRRRRQRTLRCSPLCTVYQTALGTVLDLSCIGDFECTLAQDWCCRTTGRP